MGGRERWKQISFKDIMPGMVVTPRGRDFLVKIIGVTTKEDSPFVRERMLAGVALDPYTEKPKTKKGYGDPVIGGIKKKDGGGRFLVRELSQIQDITPPSFGSNRRPHH